MSRSRPASNPISFHKHTKQYYVTRGGKRIYLGSNKEQAIKKYHRLGLGLEPVRRQLAPPVELTAKELANRFITAQQANWRNPKETLRCYKDWLGRFIKDHPRLKVVDFTVEMFAEWKLSLRRRKYSAKSINHYLSAVKAMFSFAEDTDLITKSPKLKRVKNEKVLQKGAKDKPLYTLADLQKLLKYADLKLQTMIMLALNCGFGPKDIHDLTWDDIEGERITLPRSKTGVCQTYLLWSETGQLLDEIRGQRAKLIISASKSKVKQSNYSRVFVTRFQRPWSKDALAEQFRKLCIKAGLHVMASTGFAIVLLRQCRLLPRLTFTENS